jgi:DNA polymerase-3 subunit chi
MEVWFYHLTRQPLEEALPTLLERSLDRGWRAVVQARSEERLAALDDALWTFNDASFLAHGRGEIDAALQPVFLTTGAQTPNGAAIRFFVENADLPAFLDAEPQTTFERIIFMFDGADATSLEDARAQWRTLKARGLTLVYWRQTDSGGWEKVA